MKKSLLGFYILSFALLLCACSAEQEQPEDYHIDLSDPSQGIYTAADLIAFFESGEGDTAVLGGSIDLAGDMLKLTRRRGSMTIQGNGNSLTSGGDCVIRLEDGAVLTLNDVTVIAGADGLGCLGDAQIGGTKCTIEALTNAVHCVGDLTVMANSDLLLSGAKGSGLIAQSLTLSADARVTATGTQSAVRTLKNDLTLSENAYLNAKTSAYYCALKSAGMLRMQNGAQLVVVNEGDYHGAEINGLMVEGAVTIDADGGARGVGLFLFDLHDDIVVMGHCEAAARFESGNGSLTFVDTPEAVERKQAEFAAAQEETVATQTTE
ncbi:MAG: hypothetical protein Q4E65_00485 [Clostridia bacterium]|nr:hypothetical protein [Clostridia bacterium]